MPVVYAPPPPLPTAPPAPIDPPPPPVDPNVQIAQAYQTLNNLGNQVAPYNPKTPEGQITSSPRQATADTLNNLEQGKRLDTKEGEINAQGLAFQAAKDQALANEKQQQSNDFNTLLASNQSKYQDAHNQTQAAYDEYRKSAGSLKDPTSQFWEDKGTGSRIVSALAAFSSGMGAGLTGHGGNPFMDFLQKQIDNNFQAHKQNIEDKYNSAVAAGRIEDNVENHSKFMNEAKLKSYDLSSAHIAAELQAIQNSSASQVAKVTAAKAVAGLEQNGIQLRAQLAQQEAAKAAAALAAQRAEQKEIREHFSKFLELHNKDMGENESRAAVGNDLLALGYNRSQVSSLMSGLGADYDAKKDQFVIPKASDDNASAEPAHYDDSGKLVLPTKTATGKRIDPKDLQEVQKDITEKTANVNGKPQIFRTKEYAQAVSAIPEAKRLQQTMQDAWNAGDAGTYNQARSQFIEMAPKLLEYRRGPSEAQAGGIDKGDLDQKDRATIAGQLPEFEVNKALGLIPYTQNTQGILNRNVTGMTNTSAGIALHKLAGVKTTLDAIEKEALANTASPQKPAPPSAADLAAKLGGKAL